MEDRTSSQLPVPTSRPLGWVSHSVAHNKVRRADTLLDGVPGKMRGEAVGVLSSMLASMWGLPHCTGCGLALGLVEIICIGLVEHLARICKNQRPGHRTSFQELLLEHLIGDSPAPKLNRWCGALRSTVAVHSFRKILVGGASVVGRHEACDSNPDGVPTNSLVWSTSDHFCVPAATSRIIWPMKQMRAIALPW